MSPLRQSSALAITTMSPSLTMASIIESPLTCRANRPLSLGSSPRVISIASSAPKTGESVPGSNTGSLAKIRPTSGTRTRFGPPHLADRRRVAAVRRKPLDELEHPLLEIGDLAFRHSASSSGPGPDYADILTEHLFYVKRHRMASLRGPGLASSAMFFSKRRGRGNLPMWRLPRRPSLCSGLLAMTPARRLAG